MRIRKSDCLATERRDEMLRKNKFGSQKKRGAQNVCNYDLNSRRNCMSFRNETVISMPSIEERETNLEKTTSRTKTWTLSPARWRRAPWAGSKISWEIKIRCLCWDLMIDFARDFPCYFLQLVQLAYIAKYPTQHTNSTMGRDRHGREKDQRKV